MNEVRFRPREKTVLALIEQGLSCKAIAEKLVIKPRTARNYVAMIKIRLAIATGKQFWTMQEIAEFARSRQ